MKFSSVPEMLAATRECARPTDDGVSVTNADKLRGEPLDRLTYTAVFGDDDTRAAARWLIWEIGWDLGVYSASIYDLYQAAARGEYSGVTIPAVNFRGLTYDVARALVRAAKAKRNGTFIFELARSEMGYTGQACDEFATVVMAAAIREGHRGPIFIQGDHYQANAKRYATEPEKEIEGLRALIREAVAAGYGNVDIDTSTLVDLGPESLDEQQKHNVERTAELAKLVRELEPPGVTISIGGEIGEVGKHNSTVGELKAYLDGFNQLWSSGPGLSKVSIATGSSHGGVVLPDGSIAKVSIDFEVIRTLGGVAREYGLGGPVQHGASTLPLDLFNEFPKANTLEVHLATDFQNIIFGSQSFPSELRDEIHAWTRDNCAEERSAKDTEEQFVYKSRKKAWGPYRQKIWDLPADHRNGIAQDLQTRFEFLMENLGAKDTTDLVAKYVKPVKIAKPKPADLAAAAV